MSRYLIEQIEQHPQIQLSPLTEVVALVGTSELEGVELRDNGSHAISTLPICGLFVFIGAEPSTKWMAGQLAEDARGFLLAGRDVPSASREGIDGPMFLETSRPGVFCAGDVRSRSVKRVATAIGEGSMAVRLVLERLKVAGI